MDEKTISNIKYKAHLAMEQAKMFEKDGDNKHAEWFKGYGIGLMGALRIANALSGIDFAKFHEEHGITY